MRSGARAGFSSVEPPSLQDAFEKIETLKPDVVLLDLNLPDSTGVATVDAVLDRCRPLPVVVLTAQADSAAVASVLRAGAQDYLDKGEATSEVLARTVRYARDRGEYARTIAEQQGELERFASTAAHDMSAPLRSMAGFSAILSRELAGQLDPKHEEFLRHIDLGAQRLQTLLRDLLEYARSGHREDPQVTSIPAVYDAIVSELEAPIRAAGAAIQIDAPHSVECEPTAIRVVLRNLVDNALKYKSTRPLEIEIRTQEDDGRCIVSVADNGLGIAADQQARIMEPFARLHAHNKVPGSGLGLATVDRIVRRHGGTLRVASEVDRGSVFSFDLAVAR